MSREPEVRWTVPDRWVWASLSELGDIIAGGTPSTKEPSYWADEINWISPADLTSYSAKRIKRGAKSISRIGLANSSAKVMPAGSVHFSSRSRPLKLSMKAFCTGLPGSMKSCLTFASSAHVSTARD